MSLLGFYHQKVHACTRRVVSLPQQPKTNILLAPADYVNYWMCMMSFINNTETHVQRLESWDILKRWQECVFGFYLYSDELLLFPSEDAPKSPNRPVTSSTFGYHLLIQTLDAHAGSRFRSLIADIQNTSPTWFTERTEANAGGILESLAKSFPINVFVFGVTTENQLLVDTTMPYITSCTKFEYPEREISNFARHTFVRLILNGYPIVNIPGYKDEAFLQILRHESYDLSERGIVQYDVSYFNLDNIVNFVDSPALIEHVELFVAVNFERYKYSVAVFLLYWILLIVAPSLLIIFMAYTQYAVDDYVVMALFRSVIFVLYFLIFNLYYKFNDCIFVPIVFNFTSVYCAVFCLDAKLVETLFMAYIVGCHCTSMFYVHDKISFLRRSRRSGIFILNTPSINHIFVAYDGTTSVSATKLSPRTNILKIKNRPINV